MLPAWVVRLTDYPSARSGVNNRPVYTVAHNHQLQKAVSIPTPK